MGAVRVVFVRTIHFWVSPEVTGASRGYIAAGGSEFGGVTDTMEVDRRPRPRRRHLAGASPAFAGTRRAAGTMRPEVDSNPSEFLVASHLAVYSVLDRNETSRSLVRDFGTMHLLGDLFQVQDCIAGKNRRTAFFSTPFLYSTATLGTVLQTIE